MPITAKMKMIIHKTKVRLPKAPTVLPMMEMRRLSVGQDFASLKTRSWRGERKRVTVRTAAGKCRSSFTYVAFNDSTYDEWNIIKI